LELCQALASVQELQQDKKGLKLKDELLYSTSQVNTSQGANSASEQHEQPLHILCPALRRTHACVVPKGKVALLGDQKWRPTEYISTFK